MKFNIKEWQDKYLIKESKLKKEIDFKNQDAFKKYNAKHKMRKTTKVNIAGKDTTAGEVTGKEAPSTASKMTPQQKEDTAWGAYESMKDLAKGKGNKMSYDKKVMQGDLEHIKKSGMPLDDAKGELERIFGSTYSDNREEWPEESKEAMHSHLEDVYADPGVPNKNTHDGSKMTPQQKKSIVSDTVNNKRLFTGYYNNVDVTELSRIYVSGMSYEDGKAELEAQVDYSALVEPRHLGGKPISKYKQKKVKKQVNKLFDELYQGKHDSRIIDPNTKGHDYEHWDKDPKVLKRIEKNAERQEIESDKEIAATNARIDQARKDAAAAKAEKLKNRTPKEIEKAKNQFKFSEYDYKSPKEYRDNVKDILQKTYDLDEVDPDRLQQMIDGADEYFYDEARSAGKAGRRSKPTSAKDFANYIEQYFDEDGIEPKNESVIRRSTRIQESRIYKTIQELKALEKGL